MCTAIRLLNKTFVWRRSRCRYRLSYWYGHVTGLTRGFIRNGPFPSPPVPLFQNECETFHMKMTSACRFVFMQIKDGHKNGFALRFALNQRLERTRKWPIGYVNCTVTSFVFLLLAARSKAKKKRIRWRRNRELNANSVRFDVASQIPWANLWLYTIHVVIYCYKY